MSLLTIPNSFSANTTILSALVNANFTAIATWAAGNIDNTNIGSAGIFASQIKPVTAGEAQFGATATGVGYKFLANDATAVPLTVSGVSGQSADLFDVTLTSGGTKAFSISSVGAGTFNGAVIAETYLLVGPGAAGSVTAGDITAARSATTGLVCFGSNAANYMDFGITTASRFGLTAGMNLLNSVNVSGYTPPTSAYPWTFGNNSATSMLLVAFSNAAALTIFNNAGSGFMPVTGGAYTNSSDAKFKKNIAPAKYGLKEIMALKPSSFTWTESDETDHGFIAQDVQAVMPELTPTITALDDSTSLGLRYHGIVAVLVSAFQEYVAAHP